MLFKDVVDGVFFDIGIQDVENGFVGLVDTQEPVAVLKHGEHYQPATEHVRTFIKLLHCLIASIQREEREVEVGWKDIQILMLLHHQFRKLIHNVILSSKIY